MQQLNWINHIRKNAFAFFVITVLSACGGGGGAGGGGNNRNDLVNDTTPPVITLSGASVYEQSQNRPYIESGALATDEVDGDLEVSITGTVDTATEGVYTLTYSATDQAGNTASVDRTVNVVFQPFITTWKTNNAGTSNINQIKIGTQPGLAYDYTVDWGDGQITENHSGDFTHTYATPGIYTVRISGAFPGIYFDLSGYDSEKLLSIEQWGSQQWQSMHQAFVGCINMVGNAVDTPLLAQVTDMSSMFRGASSFNQDINNWNVLSITNMSRMFEGASIFNQPLTSWNVASVTDMSRMFLGAVSFDQPIGNWTVTNVVNMGQMFTNASVFNQALAGWDVSSVTNMSSMFSGASLFNQPIGNWTVTNVVNMNGMFNNAVVFNQPIGDWVVAKVTSMRFMFSNATSFNQPIGGWTVSAVRDMDYMFSGASIFNAPLNNWDVSAVVSMDYVFSDASIFNQPLNNWDVSAVRSMDGMFQNAVAFDQNLGGWDISSVSSMFSMFFGAKLSTSNYDSLLIGWAALPGLRGNVVFHAGDSQYTGGGDAQAARNILTNIPYNWFISDGGSL
ncbi:MAG: BspA family leucine-rich repeat surface protein [Gammaproteobacteria bacterium]|nr:BspA family leucine-rich repeat surface protein [Gammaproteobacteria bacterium]